MSPFRKVLSLGLIWLLTVQTSRSVQAEDLGQLGSAATRRGDAACRCRPTRRLHLGNW